MARRPVRRHYFVQPKLQGRFIAVFAALAVLGGVATGIAAGAAVHDALGEVMFRAHFTERSTGDVVLPVLLRVNGVAALAIVACGALAGAWLFRRQERTLDHLCAQMGAWARDLERGTALAPAEASSPGWAAELQGAFLRADRSLRTAYASAAEAARELAALTPRDSLEAVERQLDAIDSQLLPCKPGLR